MTVSVLVHQIFQSLCQNLNVLHNKHLSPCVSPCCYLNDVLNSLSSSSAGSCVFLCSSAEMRKWIQQIWEEAEGEARLCESSPASFTSGCTDTETVCWEKPRETSERRPGTTPALLTGFLQRLKGALRWIDSCRGGVKIENDVIETGRQNLLSCIMFMCFSFSMKHSL